MPSWNIDKSLERLDKAVLRPGSVSGTMLARSLMDHDLFPKYSLKVPPGRQDREATLVWSLAIGELREPKFFFYGLTVRAAYLAARRHFKKELQPRKNSYRKSRIEQKPRKKATND